MEKSAVLLRCVGLLVCSLFTCAGEAQDMPVQWSATVIKINDSIYKLELNGQIAEGWYVYAKKDDRFGVEGIGIQWNDAHVQKNEDLTVKQTAAVVKDKIFNAACYVFSGIISGEQYVKIHGKAPDRTGIHITGFAAKEKTFVPFDVQKVLTFDTGTNERGNNSLKRPLIDIQKPLVDCGAKAEPKKGLLALFLLGFSGGLLALLTPCVFPMIPLTVAYFAKAKAPGIKLDRNCLLYGFFIFIIYVLESLPFHLTDNVDPAVLNCIATSVPLNIFFFIVFVLFAVSLFGGFEFAIPGNLLAKAGARGNLRNRSGIFFLALTLAVVSFSCTGPILGALLAGAISSNGGAWQLSAGMAGFGMGIGAPFVFFAFFPGYVRHLPKSGDWLETVKKVLGFIELALAFKFLSNADLVAHWGILKREVFILIWIVLFFSLALYLFKAFSVENNEVSKWRVTGGGVVLLFTVYLFTGLTTGSAARLSLLSGLPPPLDYSIYAAEPSHLEVIVPDVVNDYEKALLLAKEKNKPILIDFTGWACVNCRKMEENVWAQPQVAAMIRDNFILLALYVDDRQALPSPVICGKENEPKELRTEGDKWAFFQQENFHQVAQPMYALISPDERLLNTSSAYEPDAVKYESWLSCGLEAYRLR